MLKVAEKEGRSVYFFGASRKVLLESVNIIRKDFPNLEISGFSDGYTDKGLKVIGKINRTKAEVLFVALGSPEQEEWITKNIQKLETVKVAIGEGGTFDFIGGNSKKPPKFINSLGLEWFWRTFFSPNKTTNAGSRVKRVWRAVPVFIYKTVKYKIKNIEGPNEEN
jgi:N-acetylglucosaminyldiphosphoundecaprenol N-acetyl-beta-D-mannosaminyltransferase